MEIFYTSETGRIESAGQSNGTLRIDESRAGGRHTVTVTALRDTELAGACIRMERRFFPDDYIMASGYQSWTETREFAAGEHLNDLSSRPGFITEHFHFAGYGSQAFHPMPGDELQGFDYSYIRGREPLFIGSFNFRNAYLIIRFRRSSGEILLESDAAGKLLSEGDSFTLFDYYAGESGEPFFSQFSPRSTRKLFGYTSWYNHYQNINEKLLLAALDSADSRFGLFQIDDGFETFVGDWTDVDAAKFPNGLKPVVDRIHEKDMLAGIWLAPFVAEDASRVMKEHPDWIARDEAGNKIYAGCNWSGDCPLDLNVPEAVEYVRECLRFHVAQGFDFFKLDFIYAVNLKPLDGKTRAETSEFAYSLLREELGDRLVLGCGATLFNGLGKFDFCRIGPDVSLSFDDVFYMKYFHPERISTKVTVQNTMFRSGLDGRLFMNDPDVFLLRDDNMKLSFGQRKALTKINALYGSLLMTSDDIGAYDGEKKAVLEEALDLFENASPVSQTRRGDLIDVEYSLRGERRSFTYDINRGVIV